MTEATMLPSQNPIPNRRMPDTEDFAKGPEVGELLPDFTLPNQNGDMVHFAETRGDKQAMVVFHRSARW